MPNHAGWKEIVSIPCSNAIGLGAPLSDLLRVVDALGWPVDDVLVYFMFDVDDEPWITALVSTGARRSTGYKSISIDRLPVRPYPPVKPKEDPPPATPEVAPEPVVAAEPEPIKATTNGNGKVTYDLPPVSAPEAMRSREADLPVPCEKCDRRFANAQGLRAHKGMSHKPPFKGPQPGFKRGPMFGCRECSWYGESIVLLESHAAFTHNREPSDSERVPLHASQHESRIAQVASLSGS